jgi:hypothetical protein
LFTPLLDNSQLLEPAILVHENSRELEIDDRHHTLKFELRAFDERLRLQPFDQFLAQRQQDRGIAGCVFQLRRREFEVPITEAFAFVYKLVEITIRNGFESVTFLDIARAHELAREQRIEQSTEIHAEVVFDELRVELGVVRDLDRARRCQEPTQWLKRFALSRISIAETIEINYINAIGRG